jgi:hypothetical protein
MPERIVHIHIPKTAGTALRSAVAEANNGEYRVFPHYDEIKFVNIAAEDYDFYSGHIGYHTAAALNGNIITVLRNPIDRFVSVYFFGANYLPKGLRTVAKPFYLTNILSMNSLRYMMILCFLRNSSTAQRGNSRMAARCNIGTNYIRQVKRKMKYTKWHW